MVDVGDKDVTERRAVARARWCTMSPETARCVERGDAPKGDVIGDARIAGIQAAKRTAELIPLCHPLPLSFVDVRDRGRRRRPGVVTLDGRGAHERRRPGVEMEAMTAAPSRR